MLRYRFQDQLQQVCDEIRKLEISSVEPWVGGTLMVGGKPIGTVTDITLNTQYEDGVHVEPATFVGHYEDVVGTMDLTRNAQVDLTADEWFRFLSAPTEPTEQLKQTFRDFKRNAVVEE